MRVECILNLRIRETIKWLNSDNRKNNTMQADAPSRKSLASFLLLPKVLKEHWGLGISSHLPIGRRLCIIIFPRLCNQLNGHHSNVLEKGSHRISKGIVFFALGAALESAFGQLAFSFASMTTSTTVTLCQALVDSSSLGWGELLSLLQYIDDKWHLEIAPSVILCPEVLDRNCYQH